jgi:hypothetical protein
MIMKVIINFTCPPTPPRRARRPTFLAACLSVCLGLVIELHPTAVRADRRAYAATYEAVTAPQGELDVEAWSTYARDAEVLDGPPSRGFRNMLELEYGLTSRWDVALYNILDVDTTAGTAGYGGLKLETRYRLAPAGTWFVDPVLYLEYQYLRHGDANHKLELKLILAKDIARWNVAFNLAAEAEHLVTGDTVPETEYALGVSRELAGPALKLGAEIFGKAEKPPGKSIQVFAWTGPAISWATRLSRGALQGLWVTVGAGRGLTSHSESWYGRTIVGLQF